MDSVTRQMLEKIRGEIVKLQGLERSIVERFGSSSNGTNPSPSAKPGRKIKHARRNASGVDGPPRKIVIHEWLKKHGPASRGEIIAGTGLPEGTIGAYLSTEKDLFESRDGKWRAR
jgi:hypothetical protein